MRAGLVDEYFLTLAPRVVGGERPHAAVGWPGASARDAMVNLKLNSATPILTGELFLRYQVGR